jgi:shikimate dehydrogenase
MSARTRYCAVLGHPIRHSASPAMQNAGLAALGLDWRYLAFEVRPDQLRAALAGARAMRFLGLNLTVPHKVAALEWMDALDESARRWGAVNTVRFEARASSGDWQPLAVWGDEIPAEVRAQGFNTDADAIVQALREDLSLELAGATVVLFGAGGAGRVAALRLATEGIARIHLINRTRSKAQEVGTEIQHLGRGVEVSYGYPSDAVDLVINATSLGLQPGDPPPWDPQQFHLEQAHAVYDMIYRPAATPLLERALAAGCRTANGLGMLLYQGAMALALWSGQTPPLAVMRRALEEHVSDHSNR